MKKMIFALMLVSSMAFANVSVYDHAGVLSQAQQTALTTQGSRWPFDLHVLTGTYPTPNAFESAVHNCVNGPNVVCIGIDPAHHKTSVHTGTATGIPSGSGISAVGNPYFKNADYQGGIEAIASRARELYHSNVVQTTRNVSTGYTQQPIQVHIDNPNTGMSTGWWLFAILMLALIGIGTWVVVRARKTVKKINDDMNDFRDEAFEMSSRNMETRDWHEKMKTKVQPEAHPMMPAQTTTALPAKQDSVNLTIGNPVANLNVGGQQANVVVAQNVPATTVVHNHYGNNLGYSYGPNPTLTGSVVGDVILANELARPAPVVVEREVVHERSYDNSADNSSWNNSNNDSSSDSSSWGNNDSSSSSSWDSGSSSSDSSGSSDWGSSDSGSSGGGSDDSSGW